jgi:hypothetical protein
LVTEKESLESIWISWVMGEPTSNRRVCQMVAGLPWKAFSAASSSQMVSSLSTKSTSQKFYGMNRSFAITEEVSDVERASNQMPVILAQTVFLFHIAE